MTNLFGLCCLALALYISHMPETHDPPPPPDRYAVAESLGCLEVLKVCRVKHRMTEVRQRVAGR